MITKCTFFGVITAGLLFTCSSLKGHSSEHKLDPDLAGEPVPWTSKEFLNDPMDFQFAIMGDRTGDHRPGVFAEAVEKLNLLQPEFVMSVGDLIEGYSMDPQVLTDQWDEVDSILEDLEMRFFFVPGNHDISNEQMAAFWNDRKGMPYYHFVYQDVLFLCLNTEDQKPNHLGPEQLSYIERVLNENNNVRWTLLFLHKPLWIYLDDGVTDTGWDKVEAMLSDRQYSVFAGHFHSYTASSRNDRRYIILATTGGASSLRGPEWGELDHVCWITMTSDGPRVANLELSGILDENIVTREGREIIQSLSSKVGVSWQPIYSNSGNAMASTDVVLTLKNDTVYPLNLSLDFQESAFLKTSPLSFSTRISPQSRVLKSIRIIPGEAAADVEIPSLPFTTSLSFENDGQRVIDLAYEQELVVMRRQAVLEAQDHIQVDGVLNDWPSLNDFLSGEVISPADRPYWDGKDDAALSVQVLRDETYVYIAVHVVDEHLHKDKNTAPWYQDSVCLRIDGREASLRSANRDGTTAAGISYIEFMMTPGDNFADMHPKFIDTLPDECLAVCRRSADGYSMEVAVPMSWFKNQQSGSPDGFRVNAYLNDVDDNPHRIKVWWRPPWETTNSWAGSGTFFF